jgi:hypothetical protein
VETFLRNAQRPLLLAGAGVSTESGVPDYRSPEGAYSKGHRPMRDHEFRSSEANRRRYWARSFLGWRDISSSALPNQAHRAITHLIRNGWASNLVTQNVDRLDLRAGSPPNRILELHGTTHEVVCLHCNSMECRHNLQERLKQHNPNILQEPDGDFDPRRLQRPDGDAEIGYVDYSQVWAFRSPSIILSHTSSPTQRYACASFQCSSMFLLVSTAAACLCPTSSSSEGVCQKRKWIGHAP